MVVKSIRRYHRHRVHTEELRRNPRKHWVRHLRTDGRARRRHLNAPGRDGHSPHRAVDAPALLPVPMLGYPVAGVFNVDGTRLVHMWLSHRLGCHRRRVRVLPVPGSGVWHGCLGNGRSLPLGAVALQVAEKTKTQRVLEVHTLDADEVPGHLCGAFTETSHAVLECQGSRVHVVSAKTFKQQEIRSD